MASKFPSTPLDWFNLAASKYEASTGGCTREVARYVISILPNIDGSSHILDNACGNGIVAQELVTRAIHTNTPLPAITCVDGAKNMVELARESLTPVNESALGKGKFHFSTAPGEDLGLPQDTFTHSITNLGILFFLDGAAGAKEIYRTLAPGGTAVVTSWRELGYITTIQATQKITMPDAPLFRVPVSPDWFTESHVQKTMEDAGFKTEMHTKKVYFAAKTAKELAGMLLILMVALRQGWSEEQTKIFEAELERQVEKDAVKIERVVVGGKEGETEELLGLEQVAIVAVGKK